MTAAAAPTGAWRTATVRSVEHPSPHAVVLRLEVPDRIDHLPGQHYVIRLTADDGYVAQRSYSIASPTSDPLLECYVERLDGGEVSSFLAEVAEVGDELEVRGPIGGWFVWRGDTPALGVAGGSGAAPLVSMLRHARDLGRPDLLHLAVSAATIDRVPYADELAAAGALIALSRADADSGRAAGRLTAQELAPLVPAEGPCFVCGSARFADGATDLLTGLGVADHRIRVERFGPSG
ncbi:MAG: FAD-binding oxidoreductase [Jatrophihabitans sp.]|uniref:FAD-binding oxidoreductase n=1 Tax=Jatrophihabitans sp. TaxID=1932789 RepID=UPI003F80B6A9